MKNFWKKTKKSVTLGMAKVVDGVSSDAKKKETDDPAFFEQSERLRVMREQCTKITRALYALGKEIENLANVYSAAANTISDIITPDCQPYYQYSSQSQEGINEVHTYARNFSSYYLKNDELRPLNDMNDEIERLKILREKRKKNKVLLQQEEGHLKTAQSKNKDVDAHVEKTRMRREKFEKYNSEFLSGVSTLYDNRNEIYGHAFNIYQFYLTELVELQQKCIGGRLEDFPFESLQGQVTSCSAKPQLNLTSSQGQFNLTSPSPSQSTITPTYVPPQNTSVPTVQPVVVETNIPLNPYSAADQSVLPNTSGDFPM
ncbi:hypothetical protein TRFO_05936 [Tritrichomonas foetus]|uniref:BAR domain-containing protein n=1 Tax=Tritrichomonas foetus TaxID=1144522 RepID=A0A1J4K1U0_9EUKA|nr:hypothetical protein TRFO_05936 [Tritrichomonas foetus]|eukprot:OHT05359.1 hypothetical protein TRFO_05936 [Tritrichomonas foetus]